MDHIQIIRHEYTHFRGDIRNMAFSQQNNISQMNSLIART